MIRRDPGITALLGLTIAAILGVLAALVSQVGRPYPGFFFSADYRVFPVSAESRAAGLGWGDRIVSVDGRSPLTLMDDVDAARGPLRYEVERGGRRLTIILPPRTFAWSDLTAHFAGYFVVSIIMLAVGVVVFAQNRAAAPNRNFLIYMCLWAISNVAVPEAVLGTRKYAAILVSFVPPLLSVHGWIFFLTYPANPARQAWLERHRVIPILYRAAFAAGTVMSLAFVVIYLAVPELLVSGPLYAASIGFQFALAAASFPIKIAALLDTRRRAASPLVNQQISVLISGIGLGLGLWLTLMLAPLIHYYQAPVDPQVGSALVLLYPLAIAYATVRYRLFDATVVIRRSVVYTMLAGLITGAYALLLAAANALLAHSDLTRSPWFSAAFMFGVALAFNPLREWVRRAVDRTFFRERYDYARTIQALARSMRSLLDLDEITRRLTTTVESAMHVSAVRLSLDRPAAPIQTVLDAGSGAISRYQVAADPRFTEVSAAAVPAYAALGAEVIVPLRFQAELQGLLLLGPKRSEAAYTAEDLELLETLADQAAVAVANAEAHRRVLDYARELERSLLIRTNLAKFVPQRVRQLIEESPEAPSLDKRETEVSVLFADITGYTRLTARLAPDDLDALVERYFGAFLDEIVKHGGDVNETAGDGLMVIFHEGEHARAAVEAARGIHRRAAEIGAELAERFEPFAMHIGVNTGPALLGATKIEGRAGTRWTYTASGMTTNVAARLAAQAGAGEIVISESTFGQLGAEPPVEDLGLRELKNVERPVRLYRLR
ncbi:MAG TPA: adenylate/guanylate cyclase domain-containing protein [Methylomirabilota bacterium]|jgi:class 3 adenylate cyclase|nr:adenylate/guanylate cyclase domain-containing protein [Methylomirabilota bacterium]